MFNFNFYKTISIIITYFQRESSLSLTYRRWVIFHFPYNKLICLPLQLATTTNLPFFFIVRSILVHHHIIIIMGLLGMKGRTSCWTKGKKVKGKRLLQRTSNYWRCQCTNEVKMATNSLCQLFIVVLIFLRWA